MSTDGQIIDIHLISYLLRVGTSNLKSRKSSYIDNVNIHHSFPFNTHIVFYLTLWWEGCLPSPHIHHIFDSRFVFQFRVGFHPSIS